MATTVGAPSDAELARRSARLRLPTWLAGGNPIEFGRMCRWRMEVADLAGGEWDVRLEERVRRKPARVVQANRLATMSNVGTVGAYSRLRRLPADTVLFRGMPYEYIQAELNRLGAQRPDDLAVLMYRATLATGTVAPDHSRPGRAASAQFPRLADGVSPWHVFGAVMASISRPRDRDRHHVTGAPACAGYRLRDGRAAEAGSRSVPWRGAGGRRPGSRDDQRGPLDRRTRRPGPGGCRGNCRSPMAVSTW